MGLDAVEIVMEVEEAFGIQIPDNVAQQIETVGQLHKYVVQQTRGPKRQPGDDVPARTDICLTAATFYLLRRELCEQLGLDRRHVRPRVPLETLLPHGGRRHRWSKLARALNLRFPALVRPRWLVAVNTALGLAASFAATDWAGWPLAYLVGPVVLAATGGLIWCFTLPLASGFSSQLITIGDLCNVLLAHNYRMLVAIYCQPSPTDVFQTIKTILVEQLGVHPALVTKDASLVKDLGME
jgi:acyl carrier protein